MIKSLLYLTILLYFTLVSAHFRLNYPTARNDNTGLKTKPCGGDAFWSPGDAVTVLSPGINTISLYETIPHDGSPFRVALSVNSDDYYEDLVLMDHIPDWVGPSGSKYMYIDVEIPDIDCEYCSIQVFNPMTDKNEDGSCCEYPEGGDGCVNSLYVSCANIRINGTQDVTEWANSYHYMGVCGPYASEVGTWDPYELGGKYNSSGTTLIFPNCAGYQRNCQKRRNTTLHFDNFTYDGDFSSVRSTSTEDADIEGSDPSEGFLHAGLLPFALLCFSIL
eukprot:TRINITY_DN7212_c0_g1_i1.p1 TRINITY_DN7212_c0_g1~~TRINITY_DN7212_c0_g1_i1.p1  ORF type:complete len:287 (+),score=47.11 TRINITY_DN7212_c0_g1_i1:31-861(+)